MDIAHVALSLDVGGLERLVIDLVREGMQLGQEQAVICLERPGTLAPQAEAIGARVLCVGKRPGLRPGIVAPLARVLRELQADVVHTHQIGALAYAGPAARRARVPVVIHTEHGKHYAVRRRTRWLGRLAGRYAQRFCCVSQDIADEVRAMKIVPREKIVVVPNGIDVERFRGQGTGNRGQGEERGQRSEVGGQGHSSDHAPHDDSNGAGTHHAERDAYYTRDRDASSPQSPAPSPSFPAPRPSPPVPTFTIGTVGRLNEIKRQDVLIRAFARLVCRKGSPHPSPLPEGEGKRSPHPSPLPEGEGSPRPNPLPEGEGSRLRLLIVGDGPMRGELERLADQLGVREHVEFAGYQPAPEDFLRQMDIFALTSRSEGMPLSILEAWAAGLPVVASRVGGVSELVEDHVTGRLFASGDDAELAAILERLCHDGEQRLRLDSAGQARVEAEFSLARMAETYDSHYRELFAASNPLRRTRRAKAAAELIVPGGV